MPREFCRSCYQRLGGGAVICESCAAGGAKQPAYLAELRGKGSFFFFLQYWGARTGGPCFSPDPCDRRKSAFKVADGLTKQQRHKRGRGRPTLDEVPIVGPAIAVDREQAAVDPVNLAQLSLPSKDPPGPPARFSVATRSASSPLTCAGRLLRNRPFTLGRGAGRLLRNRPSPFGGRRARLHTKITRVAPDRSRVPQELHQLWGVLHKKIVSAVETAGLPIWLAVATLLAFGRHQIPIPWHGVAEYGFHAKDRVLLTAALRRAGLATNRKRGILRAWLPCGQLLRVVYGRRALESHRSQTWPWADLFAYERAGPDGFSNLCGPSHERNSGKARIRLQNYTPAFFAGQTLLCPTKEEAGPALNAGKHM